MKRLSIDIELFTQYIQEHTLKETANYFKLSYQQVKDYCHHNKIEVVKKENREHGCSKAPQYVIWKGMMNRCYDEKNKDFSRYGARGIKVCEHWHKVENFVAWCLQNGWEKGLQLDRINNDYDYCPNNCRFVTRTENMSNRRNTIYIDNVPLTKILSNKEQNPYNIERHTAWYRLVKLGWSIEKTLGTPSRVTKNKR